jgi:hypothetical protein
MLDKKIIFQNLTLFKLDVGRRVMFVDKSTYWSNRLNYMAPNVFHLLIGEEFF